MFCPEINLFWIILAIFRSEACVSCFMVIPCFEIIYCSSKAVSPFRSLWKLLIFPLLFKGGDSGTKRVKVDQDAEGKIPGEPHLPLEATMNLDKDTTSTLLETDASSSNVTSIGRVEKASVDQLPKEMHEMKIRDDKVDNHDEKVIFHF